MSRKCDMNKVTIIHLLLVTSYLKDMDCVPLYLSGIFCVNVCCFYLFPGPRPNRKVGKGYFSMLTPQLTFCVRGRGLQGVKSENAVWIMQYWHRVLLRQMLPTNYLTLISEKVVKIVEYFRLCNRPSQVKLCHFRDKLYLVFFTMTQFSWQFRIKWLCLYFTLFICSYQWALSITLKSL